MLDHACWGTLVTKELCRTPGCSQSHGEAWYGVHGPSGCASGDWNLGVTSKMVLAPKWIFSWLSCVEKARVPFLGFVGHVYKVMIEVGRF